MQVWNVLHAARWKYSTQKLAKNRHLGIIAQICRAVSSQLRHVSTIGKQILNSNTSSTCPDNMVFFNPLSAEIGLPVWGTHANFNGFLVMAALLHGMLVVGVSQTLRRWTDGATFGRAAITLGIGPHSSFFYLLLLSSIFFPRLISAIAEWMYTILVHMVWP